MITPPRYSTDYPDRNLDCQKALESRVIALIDDARVAGWNTADITVALVELAGNLMLQAHAIEETDRQIAETRRRQ